MMFTRCEIGRADVLLRWSSPAESNSHFMDEGFICKSSLPCHFQDCLSTGESYFQISQRQPASFFFYYYFLGVGGLQIFCCRLSWLYAIFFYLQTAVSKTCRITWTNPDWISRRYAAEANFRAAIFCGSLSPLPRCRSCWWRREKRKSPREPQAHIDWSFPKETSADWLGPLLWFSQAPPFGQFRTPPDNRSQSTRKRWAKDPLHN